MESKRNARQELRSPVFAESITKMTVKIIPLLDFDAARQKQKDQAVTEIKLIK